MNETKPIQKSQIDFNGAMEVSQDAIMSRLNCHNIGRILEFDKDTQTCSIELMQIKQFGERLLTPAPITDVPLIILGSEAAHITMPDPTGTICLLLFMDRNIDTFLKTGEQYVPETGRMHDFTDCIALATFKTLVNPIQNYDDKAITLYYEEIIEEIKNYSSIKITPTGVILNNSLGAEISVTDKIDIKNGAQSLTAIMDSFLTACENIKVDPNSGILTPESKQQFTELKTQFKELLYDNAESGQ